MAIPISCRSGGNTPGIAIFFVSLNIGQASVHIYTPPDGGSLRTSGHEMNLRANMAQKRSVFNATPANEIGMAGELRIGY